MSMEKNKIWKLPISDATTSIQAEEEGEEEEWRLVGGECLPQLDNFDVLVKISVIDGDKNNDFVI